MAGLLIGARFASNHRLDTARLRADSDFGDFRDLSQQFRVYAHRRLDSAGTSELANSLRQARRPARGLPLRVALVVVADTGLVATSI